MKGRSMPSPAACVAMTTKIGNVDVVVRKAKEFSKKKTD